MSRIEIFQVDVFTDKVFHGNPAAICLMQEWLNDELLQAIALQNNLTETAFVIEDQEGFQIRWFTPNGEVDLCGHATLAAGFLMLELGKSRIDRVQFSSLSGRFSVQKKNGRVVMDLPRIALQPLHPATLFNNIISASVDVVEVYDSELDYLVLLANENQVLNAQIDLEKLAKLPRRGLILTAKSQEYDIYSRCFYPKYHIPEDAVTGSAHCVLAPFWSQRLNQHKVHALQGLLRKGEVFCEVYDDHVLISGYCRWYSKGYLMI